MKQNLTCHYSAQKQMGRPRKRQKTDDFGNNDDVDISAAQPSSEHTQSQQQASRTVPPPAPAPAPELAIDPELSEKVVERTNFENICNAPISQTIRRSAAQMSASHQNGRGRGSGSSGNPSQGSSSTSPYDAPRTPSDPEVVPSVAYPTDVSLWPDFSDMTMLPMMVQDNHEQDKMSTHTLSDVNGSTTAGSGPYSAYSADVDTNPSKLTQLPASPACPCLPNMYLTLSTLSTLSAFPVSSGTIDALLSAHRTGRSVIYCTVCPQKMQTGAQNVMLSSMLITVLSDHWHRVKKASAKELRSGFTNLSESGGGEMEVEDLSADMSVREDLEWRTFGYNLVRAYVYGDKPIPVPPNSTDRRSKAIVSPTPTPNPGNSSSMYTLEDLVSALERRQKQWHNVEPYANTTEFPPRLGHSHGHREGYAVGMTLEDVLACEEESRASGDEGVLCLRIVRHARTVMRSLDGAVPRVEA